MIRITEAVKHLIIINVLFFIATISFGDQMFNWFSLWLPNNPNFKVWQLVTYMFMHGGIDHIFFNMFGLYMFGSLLEQALGTKRFLVLYFAAGLGALIFQLLASYYNLYDVYNRIIASGVSPESIDIIKGSYYGNIPAPLLAELTSSYNTILLGASGSVMGITAAVAYLYPNVSVYVFFIPIPVKMKYVVGFYIATQVFSVLTGTSFFGASNTAYWAHIGGAVIGFITMWYWKKNMFNNNRWN